MFFSDGTRSWRGGGLAILTLVAFAIFAMELGASIPALAQWGSFCPPGSTAVTSGYATACMCPDGSYANLGQPCAPRCPANTQECGDVCCNAGFFCSKFGCAPHGAVDCGAGYCNPGQKCSRNGGCIAQDRVDCGNYNCPENSKCGSGWRGCVPHEAVDCGPVSGKGYCDAGHVCTKDNKCITEAEDQRRKEQAAEAKRQEEQRQRAERDRRRQEEEARKASFKRDLAETIRKAQVAKHAQLQEQRLQAVAKKKTFKETQDESTKAAQTKKGQTTPDVVATGKRNGLEVTERKKEQVPTQGASPPSPSSGSLAVHQHQRDRIWPRVAVPTSPEFLRINSDKLSHDWVPIQMAEAAYSSKLKVGDTLFRGENNWRVLERHVDENTGFYAYTFVNISEHRLIVAVRGSDSISELAASAQSMLTGDDPSQFAVARNYITDIKRKFGDRFYIDCTGHSYGGGACVSAAANIDGVHAIAIDPISPNSIATKNAYLIDNYVVNWDAPNVEHRITERGLTGWMYKVPGSPLSLGTNPYTRHKLDGAINAIGAEAGLERHQLNE